MKKLLIFGAIIVLLFGGIIALTTMSNSDKLENNPYGTNDLRQSTIDLLSDEHYQNIILPEPLAEKIASGEPTVAYMFSPECSYCKNLTPKLMPIAAELDVHIDQLNVLEYDEWATYGIEATPTLIYFENGTEVARMTGDTTEDEIRKFFNEAVLN